MNRGSSLVKNKNLFFKALGQTLEPTQPLIEWASKVLIPGVRRMRLETLHSSMYIWCRTEDRTTPYLHSFKCHHEVVLNLHMQHSGWDSTWHLVWRPVSKKLRILYAVFYAVEIGRARMTTIDTFDFVPDNFNPFQSRDVTRHHAFHLFLICMPFAHWFQWSS